MKKTKTQKKKEGAKSERKKIAAAFQSWTDPDLYPAELKSKNYLPSERNLEKKEKKKKGSSNGNDKV